MKRFVLSILIGATTGLAAPTAEQLADLRRHEQQLPERLEDQTFVAETATLYVAAGRPDDAAALWQRLGRLDAAVQAYSDAAAATGSQPQRDRWLLSAARLQTTQGDAAQGLAAVKELLPALRDSDRWREAMALMLGVWQRQERVDAELQALTGELSAAPNNLLIRRQLLCLYGLLQRYPEAANQGRELGQRSGQRSDYELWAYAVQADPAAAAEALATQLAALPGGDPARLLRLAAALTRAGQPQQALQAVESYATRLPDDPYAQAELAKAYARADRPGKAYAAYQHAAERSPNAELAWQNRLGAARMQLQMDQAEAGLATAQAALAAGLDSGVLRSQATAVLVQALRQLGQLDAYLDQAVAAARASGPAAPAELLQLLERAGDFPRLLTFSAAAAKDSPNAENCLLAARAALALEHPPDDAAPALLACADMLADDYGVQEQVALALAQMGLYDKALTVNERAVAAAEVSQRSALLTLRADLLRRTRQPREAIAALQQAAAAATDKDQRHACLLQAVDLASADAPGLARKLIAELRADQPTADLSAAVDALERRLPAAP